MRRHQRYTSSQVVCFHCETPFPLWRQSARRKSPGHIKEALERFRSQAEVHHRLMHCTEQLTHWLEHAPEVVAHVDARDWAHDLVESRGWVAAEPLVFLD